MDGEIIEISDKVSGRHTGVAPEIRRLATRFPELSERAIAQKVGCDPSNVHKVLARFRSNSFPVEDFEAIQANLPDAIASVKLRILMSLDDEVIAKAPLQQRVVAYGILSDKEALLRGQPTGMDVHVLVDAVRQCRDMRRSGA
jgi:hypothetical protein